VASFITDLTGRPLQTLDRKPVPRPADPAFAATVGTGPGMAAVSPPSTNSRGEIQPIAQPKGGLRTGILVGALAGTAALIAAIVLLGHKPPPISAGASDLAAPPLIARPQPDLAPALVAVSARDLGAPATAIAHPPVTGTHHPPKEETIPPEVQAELASADKALAAGNLTEAVHQARHSLNQRKTSRAFAIITRAYCKGGDLGNANAAFHSVTGGDRAAVKSFCHGAGVDLP
jgi:serine/threonine-protein kinase